MQHLDQPILFLATANPKASRVFFESTLGLAFLADDPSALVFDVGGKPLRIQKVNSVADAGYTVMGWSVEDIHQAIVDLSMRGVEFVRYSQLLQDESGIWAAPNGAKVAWFKDPDGNTLSLTEISVT